MHSQCVIDYEQMGPDGTEISNDYIAILLLNSNKCFLQSITQQ